MWTTETSLCRDCGSEITLFTDGRVAYAVNDGATSSRVAASGETNDVWRDGLALVVACPAYLADESGQCHGETVFTGEGASTPGLPWLDRVAAPILDEAP